jgi:hypothetical protein
MSFVTKVTVRQYGGGIKRELTFPDGISTRYYSGDKGKAEAELSPAEVCQGQQQVARLNN